jgi:hypothetical protein
MTAHDVLKFIAEVLAMMEPYPVRFPPPPPVPTLAPLLAQHGLRFHTSFHTGAAKAYCARTKSEFALP